MLTTSIYQGYTRGIEKLSSFADVELVARGKESNGLNAATPHVYHTTGSVFLQHIELMEEVFGPSSIHVTTQNKDELLAVANQLTGQLTVSIWATDKDLEEYSELISILELKAGRIIYNTVPTGVEVTYAMVHGGPFPATTDSKFTSVGTNAIYRFTRPVCYQSIPQKYLPEELKDENPLSIWRMVNGSYSNAAVNS
jgi:2,5-dioxopentanoate dehydrogenase